MNKTKKKILEKIRKNEVKMKPKWKFEAEKAGVSGGVVLTMLLAAIGLSMVAVFWQVYNPKELAEYGEVGWALFKEDFPYLWLFGAIILGIGGVILESKLGDNYKKPTKVLVILAATVIAGLTIVTVWTRNLLKIGL